jgi:hypothetical protein
VVESPVPYLIGLLGDKKSRMEILNSLSIYANIVVCDSEKKNLELIIREKLSVEEPYLRNLKVILKDNIKMAHYYLSKIFK